MESIFRVNMDLKPLILEVQVSLMKSMARENSKEGSVGNLLILEDIKMYLKKPHLTPQHDLVSNIVYSSKGNDVCTTIVDGKPLMIDNNYLTLKYDKIIDDAEKCAKDLTSKV